MVKYVFDGTFEGMLTAIYEAYYGREKPEQILFRMDSQENFFDQKIFIQTKPEKAAKVYAAVKKKISREAWENIIYAFLSENENIGTWVLSYLDFGWKTGQKLDLYLDDDRVKRIHDLSRRVRNERHRMLGLLRFRRLSLKYVIYYAPFEPDHNITMLLAPHFARRLSDQNWIIHDVKRNSAAAYNKQEWIMTDLTLKQVPPLAQDEAVYQDLWKQYYLSIGISERDNPKLQKQMMPMKYWKYLTEKAR